MDEVHSVRSGDVGEEVDVGDERGGGVNFGFF